jgi:hypothetical protein
VSDRARRLSVSGLVLALAIAQLALAHVGVFVSALALGFQAHGHGHAVTLVADAGHVDVVLHHEGEPPGHAPGESSPWAVGAHDGDHVVHMASGDGSREGARRAGPAHAALLLAPASLVPPAGPTLPPASTSDTAGTAAAHLRTVVLRV